MISMIFLFFVKTNRGIPKDLHGVFGSPPINPLTPKEKTSQQFGGKSEKHHKKMKLSQSIFPREKSNRGKCRK